MKEVDAKKYALTNISQYLRPNKKEKKTLVKSKETEQ